jgi:FtsZ-binding cell division protein ZapB
MDNAFDQLEEKVKKAAEVVKALRHENKTLQDELGRIRPRLQEVEKTVAAMERDRDKGPSPEDARRLDALGSEVKDLVRNVPPPSLILRKNVGWRIDGGHRHRAAEKPLQLTVAHLLQNRLGIEPSRDAA